MTDRSYTAWQNKGRRLARLFHRAKNAQRRYLLAKSGKQSLADKEDAADDAFMQALATAFQLTYDPTTGEIGSHDPDRSPDQNP